MAVLTNKTSWTVTCTPLAAVLDSDAKFEINTIPLTPANLAAQQALMDTLEATLETLTLGVVAVRNTSISKEINTGLPSAVALRGAKWKLQCQENGGNNKTFVVTIPASQLVGAGPASLLVAGTTQADFTKTEWVNFKAAFEAIERSAANNPVVLQGAAYESI